MDAMDHRDYQNKTKQREIRHLFHRMNLCGCGSPEEDYKLVLALLERAEARSKAACGKEYGGPRYEDLPTFSDPLGNIPGNAVCFMAKCLDSWKLLEHGGSIGGAWVSGDGEVLLKFLRDFGTDPGELGEGPWPDWWCSCDAKEEW